MGWVYEANKIGRYDMTYQGFRLYWTKEPSWTERTETRDDGEYKITDLHKGDLVAVDKTGCRFEGHFVDQIAAKIDWEMTGRYFDKKEEKT